MSHSVMSFIPFNFLYETKRPVCPIYAIPWLVSFHTSYVPITNIEDYDSSTVLNHDLTFHFCVCGSTFSPTCDY